MKKSVMPYIRKPRNSMEISYYMPVPMNDEGGVFSIPNEMVTKKGTIRPEILEKYLIKCINDNIKTCPYKNQFIEKNFILLDFVETYYSDRISYEQDDLITDWI